MNKSPPPEINSRSGSLGNSRSDPNLVIRNYTSEHFNKKRSTEHSRTIQGSESNLKVHINDPFGGLTATGVNVSKANLTRDRSGSLQKSPQTMS